MNIYTAHHQCVVVLLPLDSRDIITDVSSLLAPFDANAKLEEYQEKCLCFGRQASEEVTDLAELAYTTIGEMVGKFGELCGDKQARLWELRATYHEVTEAEQLEYKNLLKDIKRIDEEVFGPFNQAYVKELEKHPLKDQPDPKCLRCFGHGHFPSTSNPQGIWKEWKIGGGYSGLFDESTYTFDVDEPCFGCSDEFRSRQPARLKQYEGDVVAVCSITETIDVPDAIVTPDGLWHKAQDYYTGRDRMMDIEGNDADHEAWTKGYHELLAENFTCLAVVCDLQN